MASVDLRTSSHVCSMQTGGGGAPAREIVGVSNRWLKPVSRPLALGEQVYNALRAELREGAIGAGQAMQEVQLAEQLGVSRTPVREAMARLASEGLLAEDQRSFTVPA